MNRRVLFGSAGGLAVVAALALSSTSWAHGWLAPSMAQTAAPAIAQTVRWSAAPNLADMVEQVSPSVVQVFTRTASSRTAAGPGGQNPFSGTPFEEFFNRQMPDGQNGQGREMPDQFGTGSGFFIDGKGHIVTNNHVVENAKSVTIRYPDGTQADAEVVGTDPKTDLAVIKVTGKNLPKALSWGDSDAARPGDNIFALGSPFGLGNTVTAGIVSARGRNINAGPYDDFIQVDAPINRGNSGGPLFNDAGQVIGVNSAIYSPSGGSVGIGFSIPSDLAKPIIEQIIDKGVVERGWLGVSIQSVTPDIADSLGLAKAEGALVGEVTDGSPAQKAGVQVGDLILTFGAKPINSLYDLTRAVAETPVNSTRDLKVLRAGKNMTLKAKIAKLEEEAAPRTELASAPRGQAPKADVELSELGLELSNNNGAIVSNVKVNSAAGDAGLQPGDKVLMVNQQPVSNAAAVKTAVDAAAAKKRDAVLFQVERNGQKMFVGLPFED